MFLYNRTVLSWNLRGKKVEQHFRHCFRLIHCRTHNFPNFSHHWKPLQFSFSTIMQHHTMKICLSPKYVERNTSTTFVLILPTFLSLNPLNAANTKLQRNRSCNDRGSGGSMPLAENTLNQCSFDGWGSWCWIIKFPKHNLRATCSVGVNPLMHTATSSVNSAGGCMYKGVMCTHTHTHKRMQPD